MSKKSFIRESKRHCFQAPVEIRWIDSDGYRHSVLGASHDVSIYGLGVVVPFHLPLAQELTIILSQVEICGGAVVKHEQPYESGFKIGLYFRLALLMQNVPELDKLLDPLMSVKSSGVPSMLAVLVRRCWGRVRGIAKAITTTPAFRRGFGMTNYAARALTKKDALL
jgi:hypothetical protein